MRFRVANAHRTQASLEDLAVCAVVVADQGARRAVPRESFCHSIGEPLSARVSRHRRRDQLTRAVMDDNQDVEQCGSVNAHLEVSHLWSSGIDPLGRGDI